MFCLSIAARSLGEFKKVCVQSILTRTAMTLRTTHEQRTAAERREAGLHAVTLGHIGQINRDVRLLKLNPDTLDHGDPIKARAPT